MRRISTTAFLGMLALTITGCPSSTTQQSTNPAPPPSTPPVVVSPSSAAKPPLVAQNPNNPAFLAPGLIQPTNANQRTKQVAKGNRDPFTALFVPVPVPPTSAGNTPNNNAPTQAPQVVSSPTVSSRQTTKTQTSSSKVNTRQSRPSSVVINNSRTTTNQGSSSNRTPTSTQNIPLPPNTALPDNNLQPALPPAMPETDLANNVIVMGVVQIGEQTQAIVQVPSEATSRYVQVGQRLSNGQVLVKRIELNAGAEPLVILEQYGVEVSKAVGEPTPSQTPSPTAAVPYPPSPNISTPTAAIPSPPPPNISTSTSTQNINTLKTNISFPELPPTVPVAPVAAN